METRSRDIKTDLSNIGETPSRPICLPGVSSTSQVHEQEERPNLRGTKCITAGLEPNLSIPNRSNIEKSVKAQDRHDLDYTNLGSSTMVPSTSRHGSAQPHYAASKGTTSFKSMGTNSSPVGKQNIKTSGMAHLGKNCKAQAYQNLLPDLLSVPGLQAQEAITTQPGKISLAGVINRKLVHFIAL